MEVRIGIKGALRELSIDATLSAEELEKAVAGALADGGYATLTLADEKGRRLVIAADKLLYVEIAESDARRVGFGAV